MSRDAAFPIGSISKTFTATLAMILVADGDLELDAPVVAYLPELRDRAAQLTLFQVLSHTGGLPSGPDPDPDSQDASASSLRRYLLEHCRQRDLVLAPGTGFSYSNLGYVLAGRLIEAVTGMSWCEAMEAVVLRPLGIDPAFIGGLGPQPPRRPIATGHSVNLEVGRTRPVPQSIAPAEAPTGALAMSAMDLVSLGSVHVGPGMPGLLPAPYAERMRQPVPMAEPFGLAEGWGLGLAVFSDGATRWVGHDGNADGTSCYLRVDPAGGRAVAFTSNANTGAGLWRELLAELARAGIPVPAGIPAPTGRSRASSPRLRPAPPPAGCTGTYANGDDEYVVATDDDGHLCLAMDGADFAPLTCYEGLIFMVRDPASGQQALGGRFVRDPLTGEIDGIQVGGRLARPLTHSSRW